MFVGSCLGTDVLFCEGEECPCLCVRGAHHGSLGTWSLIVNLKAILSRERPCGCLFEVIVSQNSSVN